MLIHTMERCPQCDQLLYMCVMPKRNDVGKIFTFSVRGEDELPHAIADGLYLDENGVATVTAFNGASQLPTYHCIHCGWWA